MKCVHIKKIEQDEYERFLCYWLLSLQTIQLLELEVKRKKIAIQVLLLQCTTPVV